MLVATRRGETGKGAGNPGTTETGRYSGVDLVWSCELCVVVVGHRIDGVLISGFWGLEVSLLFISYTCIV
jgi:hypothetical protein